ncbi:glycosyltransferase [Weissella muntiaci]|uniref:Glycosyltransferase n=1 Tax=Weissella muntiaci TaxID=2508881 RepID=A0A6C2C3H4_9LACO|nr:glycosyltransferase [Weissella muntiaci]TYC48093.1 glycosyltransferase [Weissella muntiaci]
MISVSVVIPAYKSARFIKETVESVLNQTDVDFELIIGVQGPDDGTWSILEDFKDDARVKMFESPVGAAKENWNFVSEKASGEFIKLLPADDVLVPGMLARQVRLLENHPEAVLTASKREIINEDNKVLKKSWGLTGLRKNMAGEAVIKRVVGTGINILGEPGGVLMRRSAFEKAGGWNFDHPYVVDLESYLRVLRFGDFVKDEHVAVKFRVSSTQWTAALQNVQSAHFIGMNESMAELMPDTITKSTLVRGKLVTKAMQEIRKFVYVFIKRNK